MSTESSQPKPDSPPRPVAVIDIGATAIRMAIAEIHGDGRVRRLESLSQEVNLGKDTFKNSSISKNTMEECVRVLRSYSRLLREYGITRPEQVRVVATSAVREAENRLAFLDRIFIATGIEIEPTEEAEVNRITYLGIQPYLESDPSLRQGNVLVVEIGGGSTEVLMIRQGDVTFARTYRLGALRLRESLQTYRAPAHRVRNILATQIDRTVDQIMRDASHHSENLELIAIGGDVRFAAAYLLPEWEDHRFGRIQTADLERLAGQMLSHDEDTLVRRYHLTFTDAETIGPALLSYALLAKRLGQRDILVLDTNLRDGMLEEMADEGVWSEEFHQQVLRSARTLGDKFTIDRPHAEHVRMLSASLFDALQPQHGLGAKHRLLLQVAALLHEVGLYVSNRAFHKHSMYLINNGELFGLRRNDVMLVALVARYHRRAAPKPTHEGYMSLGRDDRIVVAKLAAMLRVADALDRSHSQRVPEITCKLRDGRLIIGVPQVSDLSLEQVAIAQKGPLFESVFGFPVLLRTTQRQGGS